MNSQNSIGLIADRVIATGKITHIDQVCLFSAAMALERPLDTIENAKVKQVFDRLQMGLVKVLD